MKNISKKVMPALLLILSTVLLIGLDQFTKVLAISKLKEQADFPLIPGVLEFSYLENTGAAFSSFLGKQGFLIALTSCVMLFIIWKYFQIPEGKRFYIMRLTFLLIINGGIGNLIDRVRNGYVVDFIYFVPINFPTFNVADCYVSVGMVLLCIICFFYYKDDELSFLFGKTSHKQ